MMSPRTLSSSSKWNASNIVPNTALNGSSSRIPLSSSSVNVPSSTANQKSQLTMISGGHSMNGEILSCTSTSTIQKFLFPARSVTSSSTMIGPAPTSQHANGTHGRCTVPRSRLLTGGTPPGMWSIHAPSVVQSKSMQLSIRRALNVTGPQLSYDPSSNTEAGTSVMPNGPSLVSATIVCSSQFATGTTSSITVTLNVQVLELPHSSIAVQVTTCVPRPSWLITKLLPKFTTIPEDAIIFIVNEEPHSSTTVGLGTLTLAKQNQKSVPTVISVGHVKTGPSRSLILITCTH